MPVLAGVERQVRTRDDGSPPCMTKAPPCMRWRGFATPRLGCRPVARSARPSAPAPRRVRCPIARATARAAPSRGRSRRRSLVGGSCRAGALTRCRLITQHGRLESARTSRAPSRSLGRAAGGTPTPGVPAPVARRRMVPESTPFCRPPIAQRSTDRNRSPLPETPARAPVSRLSGRLPGSPGAVPLVGDRDSSSARSPGPTRVFPHNFCRLSRSTDCPQHRPQVVGSCPRMSPGCPRNGPPPPVPPGQICPRYGRA